MIPRAGYVLVHGVLVEPLGEHWAAFSPASGESHLINNTSAAIVEMLSCEMPLTLAQACAALATDVGTLQPDAEAFVGEALRSFITAGLARSVPLPQTATP